MESLFFIDTGGKEDASDQGLSDDNMEEMLEDKVMGAKDAAIEAKQRQRAIKERSLASFLFGKPKESSDAESRHSEEESDEGLESDAESEDTEEEKSDEEREDGRVDNDEDDVDEEEVTLSCAQPTLSGGEQLTLKLRQGNNVL